MRRSCMSVRAKARRMVVACVMICATVGMFIAPHVSAAVDPKMERKLFADYYRPGMDGVALDQAILKALPKTERTARAKADAAAASQCGEYQCQWDWGTGIWALSLIHISEPTRLLSISYA